MPQPSKGLRWMDGLVVGFLFFTTSCQSSQSIAEFIQQISQDPDFVQHYQDDTYVLTCAYQPAQAMALREVRSALERHERIAPAAFDSLKKIFAPAAYFTLSLGLQDSTDILQSRVSNRTEYAQRIHELTFQLGSSVYLLTSQGDTLRTHLTDFQRSYGLSPKATFLLAFPKPETRSFELVYEDHHFGIPQPVRFPFETESLNKQLPTLNF